MPRSDSPITVIGCIRCLGSAGPFRQPPGRYSGPLSGGFSGRRPHSLTRTLCTQSITFCVDGCQVDEPQQPPRVVDRGGARGAPRRTGTRAGMRPRPCPGRRGPCGCHPDHLLHSTLRGVLLVGREGPRPRRGRQASLLGPGRADRATATRWHTGRRSASRRAERRARRHITGCPTRAAPTVPGSRTLLRPSRAVPTGRVADLIGL